VAEGLKERIEKRISELTAARDTFVSNANQQIAGFNGAIGELQALLEPKQENESPADKAEEGTA
jgi:hypothetical protein